MSSSALLKSLKVCALIIAITSVVGFALAWGYTRSVAIEDARKHLESQARIMGEFVADEVSADNDLATIDLRQIAKAADTRLTLMRSDGVVVADSHAHAESMSLHGNRPEVIEAQNSSSGVGFAARFSATLGESRLYVAIAVKDDDRITAIVRTSIQRSAIGGSTRDLALRFVLASILSFAIAAIIIIVVVRKPVDSIRRVTSALQSLEDDEQDEKIHVRGNDEFASLATAFNSASSALNRRIDSMRADRKELETVLSNMLEGVIALDRDQRIAHLNSAARRMLGLTSSSSYGKPLWEVARIASLLKLVDRVVEDGEPAKDRIMPLTSKDEREIEMLAIPLEGETEEEEGILVVLYDVTELRRLETVRRDFVTNVSHELKTPLTAIRGLLETMTDDSESMDATTRTRFLERATNQVMRLSNIVSDLLTLGRFESEKTSVEMEPLDWRQLVRDAAKAVAHMAEEKGVTLLSSLPDRDVLINGDEDALNMLVTNLLDNAIKYTPAGGGVKVSLTFDGGEAKLEVDDSGIGIPEHDLDRIFERFYRVDKARSRDLGGTGLGLSIVKHITLVHGGRLGVQSDEGRGSQFHVWLPLVRQQNEAKSSN